MNEYALIKLIHLGALIFWLGPPLGAWMLLRVAEDALSKNNQSLHKINRFFYLMIGLEHFAFIVLIASGFILAYKYQLLEMDWIKQKLHIVFYGLIPFELVDIVLGNWFAYRISNKIYENKKVETWERVVLDIYRNAFTKMALLIMPVLVIVIMYLAITKYPIDLFK